MSKNNFSNSSLVAGEESQQDMNNTSINGNELLLDICIPNENVKILSSMFHFLNKIGKDLIIDVDLTGSIDSEPLSFRAINDCKSSFAEIVPDTTHFCDYINCSDKTFSCKLTCRPICAILKNIRNLQKFNMKALRQGSQHFLIFVLSLSSGFTRTHKFQYMDCELLHAKFADLDTSFFRSDPNTFANLLDHIHKSPEINVNASLYEIKVSSCEQHHGSNDSSFLKTELIIDANEFDEYEYRSDKESEGLIFTLKEMRAMLGFCLATNSTEFYFYFTNSGSPIKTSCSILNSFSVSLIVATIYDHKNAQNSQSQVSNENSRNVQKFKCYSSNNNNNNNNNSNNNNNNNNNYQEEESGIFSIDKDIIVEVNSHLSQEIIYNKRKLSSENDNNYNDNED